MRVLAWLEQGFFVTLFPITTEACVLFHGELGLTRRLPAKSRLALGVAASCLVASGVTTYSPVADALSFGGEQVSSYLGQPLRLAIPLLGATGDSLDARCYRVVNPLRSDGLTVITQARVELQTTSNPPLLIVRSNRSVDDPAVRVSIEAGCDNPIRRDYTVLLDPPPLQAAETVRAAPVFSPPVSSGISVTVNEAVAPPSSAAKVVVSAADRAERRERARAKAAAARANVRASSSDRQRSSPKSSANVDKSLRIDPKPANTQPDQLRVQDGSGTGGAVVADASLAALAVPRLKIASDLPSFELSPQGAARVTDELQAAIAAERRARLLSTPIEEDLSPRLEADLVVAKRRLAELQSQLSAAGLTAKSDTAVVGTGATAGSVAMVKAGDATFAPAAVGNWREWLWIPGALLVLGMLGFLWRQRSSQSKAQAFSTAATKENLASPIDHDVFETTRPAYPLSTASTSISETPAASALPVTALASPIQTPSRPQSTPSAAVAVNPLLRVPSTVSAEREASDRLNNPLFQLRDTTRHVDVSELSQVTDEAQVYVDLGRSDQAIDILRDHIESQTSERDSPAAWLMIFDLYRRTNNRAGYDELAPKFRTHFNGRMPDWDNYGHELALDDGLEAFPHLVAILQRDWGTPDAPKFLEELLYDNRGGSRLGFSLAAYRDILLLLQVHEELEGEEPAFASIDWESRGANDDDGTPKWDLSLEMLEPAKVGELESFLRNRPPGDRS